MKARHLLFAPANFFAVLVLAALIISPFYFAKNFAKVEDPEQATALSSSKGRRAEGIERSRNIAGVQTVAPLKLEFRTENFPNLAFSQNKDKYQVSFTKVGPTQAYLGIGVLTNQTDTKRIYEIETQSRTKVFFGQNIEEQKDQISLGAGASTAVSIFSPQEASASSQTVEFKIQTP
ncbi:MAG: hypothetical protein Q7S45_02780 [Candidatus Curtissbacteria bacterium]|nr:hypothetical protein [Candidatus Curtissbacteria bacterium]